LRQDKEISLRHYNMRLARYGEDVRALSWGSLESQQVRFQVLSELVELEESTILDVGCGFGDFYGVLKQRVHLKSYLGIDINPGMIAVAKQRFPEANFRVKDIVEDSIYEVFDYVVASGILSLRAPNWKGIMEKVIYQMYELSRVGVGINFLSRYTTGKKTSDSYYADPARILDFVCRNLSSRVILRHDYRPNDFTLYIYKPFARREE